MCSIRQLLQHERLCSQGWTWDHFKWTQRDLTWWLLHWVPWGVYALHLDVYKLYLWLFNILHCGGQNTNISFSPVQWHPLFVLPWHTCVSIHMYQHELCIVQLLVLCVCNLGMCNETIIMTYLQGLKLTFKLPCPRTTNAKNHLSQATYE